MRLNLLGETEIVVTPTTFRSWGGPRTRAVLAYIALQAPRAVGRAELIDAVWGLDPPRSVTNAIQTHVSMLRKALGPDVVETAGDGYRLGGNVDLDVVEFERGLRAGATLLAHGDPVGAGQRLRASLAVWRGPALADLRAASSFADIEAARLEELRLVALERRVEADLDAGRDDGLVAELEAVVLKHPLRETASGLLMRALYRSGRQADALSFYETFRRRLDDELGIEPSPSLRELHFGLLNQVEHDRAIQRQPIYARVPALIDETVGREAELAALESMITAPGCRLVCITGPGGMGKTRLATELGHRLMGKYRDGISFVALADAQTAADVVPTICAAIGVNAGVGDPVEVLESVLRDRQMLLICDNFEHVLDAATLIGRVLAGAPALSVVVTSRRRLNIRGEHVYPLQPLEYTVDDSWVGPAISLFTVRARAVAPHTAPGPSSLTDVAEICARCDGLPLAIELAAARTHVLTVAEIRERMDQTLPLLVRGPRDAPARHRALRTSIASSVAEMEPSDRDFLVALTVFRGGFTLAGAAAVNAVDADAATQGVETLLDHSLVRGRASITGRRFDLLETVREFLDESLDDGDRRALRRRHAEHIRRLLGPVPDAGNFPCRTKEWQILLAERPNIRAAIRWADAEGELELFADLVISAGAIWDRLGPREELAQWLLRISANASISPGRRADALTRRAWLTQLTGTLADSQALVAQAQALLKGAADHRRLAVVNAYDCWYRSQAGDRDGADRMLTHARSACTLAGSPPELQYMVHDVAMMAAHTRGDQATADLHAHEMVRVVREQGLGGRCLSWRVDPAVERCLD